MTLSHGPTLHQNFQWLRCVLVLLSVFLVFPFFFFLGVCGVSGGKGCSGLRELLGIWGVYLITTVKMLKCNLLQAVDMLTPSKIGLLFDFSIKYFFLFFWSAFHSYPEIFAF